MQLTLFKTCAHCGATRPLTEFPSDKTRKDGKHPYCNVCNRIRVKQWKEANPERYRERQRGYVASGKKVTYRKKDYRKHRTAYLVRANRWIAANRPKHRGSTRRYQKAHPEKWQVYGERRRGREMDRGEFTEQEWVDLCNRYANACACCKQLKPLTVDHVVPLCKGGSNTIDNIQPLCWDCNRKKNKQATDYRL